MKAEELVSDFAKFMGHYSNELKAIAGTLGAVVNAIPFHSDEKDGLVKILQKLEGSVDNVRNAASALIGEDIEVVISKADVADAVGDYLEQHPEVIEDEKN